MSEDTITFQLATHFLPKIALRLEYLYQTINQACEETHPVVHHYALKNVIEIIKLIEKPELKSRFLKELMRIEHMLNKSGEKVSTEFCNNLYTQIQLLTHVVGRFGENIHTNPFLQSIRLTQSTHINDCEMYSPQLLLWLETNPVIRQRDLILWLSTLRTLYTTVNTYLSLLRNTAKFETIDMTNGFYQRLLPPKTSCHLILLRINKSLGIVPRIQLGHHSLSLRLCEASTMREMRDIDAKLDLALCRL
jgi:cell division protein ZapD